MTRAALWTPGDTPQEGAKAVGLYLPGMGTNYVATPDKDALDLVGNIDVRVKVALTNWETGAYLMVKDWSCWYFRINTISNTLAVYNYGQGSRLATSSAAPSGLVNGEPMWLRFTFDTDNGAGKNVVTFYQSTTGGEEWDQVGNPSVATGIAALPVTAGPLVLGVFTVGSSVSALIGVYYAAELRNGIDGPIVAQWDGSVPHERQVDPQGNVWTVNGTANAWQEV